MTRSDAVMRRVLGQPRGDAESVRDGWLHTGDVGRIGRRWARVPLMDRNKDVIITGGANIYPREVEEVILLSPPVDQVAVVGAPDDDLGRARRGGRRRPSPQATRRRCRTSSMPLPRALSGYKRPRAYDWRTSCRSAPTARSSNARSVTNSGVSAAAKNLMRLRSGDADDAPTAP